MLYLTFLHLHSVVRWVALLGLAARVGRSAMALAQNDGWKPLDRIISIVATSAMDTQLLIGCVLFFGLSPISATAMADMGAAMRDPNLRFYAVEHTSTMFLAILLAHVGQILGKRSQDERRKHVYSLACYGVALLMVLVAIPWPFRALVGRGLY